MKEVTNEQQLDELIANSKELFLFKHSTQCGISAGAFDEFQSFAEKHPDVTCAYIDLLAHRSVSNYLAEISHVKHQSPQVILYSQGKVLWNASHRAITQQALESHIKKS